MEAAQRHSRTPQRCGRATASSGIDAGAALEHRSVPREVTSQKCRKCNPRVPYTHSTRPRPCRHNFCDPTNLAASNFLLVWVRSPAAERGPYLGRLSNDPRETTSAEALKTTYPGVVRHPGAPPIITGQPRSLFGLARGSNQHASIGAERSEPKNQHAPNSTIEAKHACNGPA